MATSCTPTRPATGKTEVRLLLDTHVWVWSQNDPAKIGAKASKLLTDASNENYISTVSTLELARLVATGAIEASLPVGSWVEAALRALDARTIEVSHPIAIEAYALPGDFHKDPADRLLVATARCHSLTLLTADERILAYRAVRSHDARR